MLVPYLTILTLQSFQPELRHFSQRLFPPIIAIKQYFPIMKFVVDTSMVLYLTQLKAPINIRHMNLLRVYS